MLFRKGKSHKGKKAHMGKRGPGSISSLEQGRTGFTHKHPVRTKGKTRSL